MILRQLRFLPFAVAFLLLSCTEVKFENPDDPDSPNYRGATQQSSSSSYVASNLSSAAGSSSSTAVVLSSSSLIAQSSSSAKASSSSVAEVVEYFDEVRQSELFRQYFLRRSRNQAEVKRWLGIL